MSGPAGPSPGQKKQYNKLQYMFSMGKWSTIRGKLRKEKKILSRRAREKENSVLSLNFPYIHQRGGEIGSEEKRGKLPLVPHPQEMK